MISIRTIAPHQWPQYREVRLRALRDSPDAFCSTWETEAARTDESWLTQIGAAASGGANHAIFAFNGEHVCGLVWCQLSATQPGVAHIYQMWVDPAARGLGVGRDLLSDAIAWARSQGMRHVRLGVTVAESPAMKLYRSHGFYPVGDAAPLREASHLMVQTMELELARMHRTA